jgi:hypothetical protein
MDPGYRSLLIDVFRRPDTPHDIRLLAAQGALSPSAHEQLALLVLLADDADSVIAGAAERTIAALPLDALRSVLARSDVPVEIKKFFAGRGVVPAEGAASDAAESLIAFDEDGEEGEARAKAVEQHDDQALLSGLPVRTKMKLAFKGTREQRAQLIRDPNRIVAAAVLSSAKLTEAEVEAFARMANVSDEVLRIIGTNRAWVKNYGTVLGLVKNPKTPVAISMRLVPRVNERDLKLIASDRSVPEAVKLAARRFVAKGLK